MCPHSRKVWKAAPFLLTLGTAKGKKNEEACVGWREAWVSLSSKGRRENRTVCGRAEVNGSLGY